MKSSANPWRSPTGFPQDVARTCAVGDTVRTGANFHPHYHVIAVTEDRAWIRDVQYGTDHIVPVDRCSKVEAGGS